MSNTNIPPRKELLKYLDCSPVSFNRYARLNEYFNTIGLPRLIAVDEGFYSGIKIGNTNQSFVDFLTSINVIQPESQLLALPYKFENALEKGFLGKVERTPEGIWRNGNIELPLASEYPFVISGNLELIDYNGSIINDTLAAYLPVINIIIIDLDKITNFSQDLRYVDQNMVRPNFSIIYDIVLRHEIGHWILHEVLVDGWWFEDKTFLNLDSEVQEFWAQLFTYNLLGNTNEINDNKDFMDYMADYQPKEYQLYKQYCASLTHKDLRNLLANRDQIKHINDLPKIISKIMRGQY